MPTLDPPPASGTYSDVPGIRVSADAVTEQQVAAYEQALEAAPDELAMQRFLESAPRLLLQHLAAAGEHWVISKKRLGTEHETDFLLAEQGSTGLTWYAVELERPQARLFTASGDQSAKLTHALRQIDDWREWLSRNRDYASRPRNQSGLGLREIDPDLDGLIIMGRDADLDPRTHDRRRRLQRMHRVRIETYDWLARQARGRLAVLQASPSSASLHGERLVAPSSAASANHATAQETAAGAVEHVFGPICEGDFSFSRTRSVEEDCVSFDFGDGDCPVLVPVNIVDSYGPARELTVHDWRDWTNHVEHNVQAGLSLLVSELQPRDELQGSLIEERPGVWFAPQWCRWKDDAAPMLYKVDVLVHLPPSSTQSDRIARLDAARQVFLKYLPEPDHVPDPKHVSVLSENL
jgi:hypothetical protein